MRVWAVPHPHAPQVQAAAGAAPGQPLVLSLPPVAALASAALGGSMPSVVDWLPAAPHDLLLVGCWDGSVAVLRMAPEQPVPPAQQQQQQQQQEQQQQQQQGGPGSSGGGGAGMHGLELLAHFSADVLPLRALRWVPPAACAAAVDGLERCLFMTGGHEGVLRVWDVRCVRFSFGTYTGVGDLAAPLARGPPPTYAACAAMLAVTPLPLPLHAHVQATSPTLAPCLPACLPGPGPCRDLFQPVYSHVLSSNSTILGGNTRREAADDAPTDCRFPRVSPAACPVPQPRNSPPPPWPALLFLPPPCSRLGAAPLWHTCGNGGCVPARLAAGFRRD